MFNIPNRVAAVVAAQTRPSIHELLDTETGERFRTLPEILMAL